MNSEDIHLVSCPECEYEKEITLVKSLDVSADPKTKKSLLSGQINLFECERCGFMDYLPVSFCYNDMKNQIFAFCFPPEDIEDEKFCLQFHQNGQMIMDDPPAIEGVEYMRTPHVVFHMTELIRYVMFRERLNGFYGG